MKHWSFSHRISKAYKSPSFPWARLSIESKMIQKRSKLKYQFWTKPISRKREPGHYKEQNSTMSYDFRLHNYCPDSINNIEEVTKACHPPNRTSHRWSLNFTYRESNSVDQTATIEDQQKPNTFLADYGHISNQREQLTNIQPYWKHANMKTQVIKIKKINSY